MPTLFLFGASEGGLFDFDATLPLMAVQVVLLTFVLNSLFFKPVGRVVEEREDYVNTSRAEAKKKIAELELLQTELKDPLKEARLEAQKVILEAEQDSENLYKEALSLATSEANAAREKARREIDVQREEALNQLKSQAGNLGELIVERLFAKK